MVGGATPSLIDNTQNTASIAPAAPNKWPTIDFVELTATSCAAAPNTDSTAIDSAKSPALVDVP